MCVNVFFLSKNHNDQILLSKVLPSLTYKDIQC